MSGSQDIALAVLQRTLVNHSHTHTHTHTHTHANTMDAQSCDLKEPVGFVLHPQLLTAKRKLVVCNRSVSCVQLVTAVSRVWCEFSTFSILNRTPLLHSKHVQTGLVRSLGI